jgi:hypothetical protein
MMGVRYIHRVRKGGREDAQKAGLFFSLTLIFSHARRQQQSGSQTQLALGFVHRDRRLRGRFPRRDRQDVSYREADEKRLVDFPRIVN